MMISFPQRNIPIRHQRMRGFMMVWHNRSMSEFQKHLLGNTPNYRLQTIYFVLREKKKTM